MNYLAQNYNSQYSGGTSIADVDGSSNFWGSLFNALPGITGATLNGVAAINNAKANQLAAQQQNGILWNLQQQLGFQNQNGVGVQRTSPIIWIVIGVVVLVVIMLLTRKK